MRVLFLMLCIVSAAHAQKVEMAALPVTTSKLIDEMRAIKVTNKTISPGDFVAQANRLLDRQGMNFALSLDPGTCARVREIKAKQKDPNAPVKLSGALKSIDGDQTKLALPDAQFAPEECGGCFLTIPLLQITDTSFITVLLGRNIGFELPGNFVPIKAELLDKDGSTVKRKWYIPERLEPIGVSHDENVLYLAFKEPELHDLSLAVFGEGAFQISTRAEAEEGGKGQKVDSNAAVRQMKFTRWGKTYVISYPRPCGG